MVQIILRLVEQVSAGGGGIIRVRNSQVMRLGPEWWSVWRGVRDRAGGGGRGPAGLAPGRCMYKHWQVQRVVAGWGGGGRTPTSSLEGAQGRRYTSLAHVTTTRYLPGVIQSLKDLLLNLN